MVVDITKTFKQNLDAQTKNSLVRVVRSLAARIYRSDVVECGMKEYIIGENKEYESVDDWKNVFISDYI